MAEPKRNLLFGFGALTTSAAVFTTGLCCIGPALLGGGLVGLAATGAWLEPYRLPLSGMSLLLLSLAFWSLYRRRRSAAGKDGIACECDSPSVRTRVLLWVLAALTLLLVSAPYWMNWRMLP